MPRFPVGYILAVAGSDCLKEVSFTIYEGSLDKGCKEQLKSSAT